MPPGGSGRNHRELWGILLNKMNGFCEKGKELFSIAQGEEFLDQLSDTGFKRRPLAYTGGGLWTRHDRQI